jgi:hypothetical protein
LDFFIFTPSASSLLRLVGLTLFALNLLRNGPASARALVRSTHDQAIIVAIDQYAEAVLGHRKFFFESAL